MSTCRSLFVYGTLMSPRIVAGVLGHPAGPGERARLAGFRRYAVAGEVYPAVVAEAGGEVHGLLLSPVTPADLRRLDAFEGAMYTREMAWVETGNGGGQRAWVYVFADHARRRLSRRPWDFDQFLRQRGATPFHGA
ncbi:MAG: gamma-glutamylcyclotransferase family protein [Gammaproteobacteria bacterium]